MKKSLLSLALCLALTHAFSQDMPDPPQKIADETTLVRMGNGKSIKIVSSNEKIASMIIEHYVKCECIRYTFSFKKDRNGKYPEWAITLPADKEKEIVDAFVSKKH